MPTQTKPQSEMIRAFILEQIENHPIDIATLTANQFNISRQAVNRHIHALAGQNSLSILGTTRSRRYILKPLEEWSEAYPLHDTLEESEIWRKQIQPKLNGIPSNVLAIWEYGFTEMFNNAIDHSSGTTIRAALKRNAVTTEIQLSDDGEGIFRKIQREFGLSDEKHAVLELSKGKLTTDPSKHSGEGIFFSSRVFDSFSILSGGVYFSHEFHAVEDWIVDQIQTQSGTTVFMKLRNNTTRTLKQVFDSFTSGDDYGFTKTVVPVRLAQYGNETLMSRSQAKRLLARVDRFKVVLFDFEGINSIGQAFADEVFRVFPNQHPHIELQAINTTQDIDHMISRARVANI